MIVKRLWRNNFISDTLTGLMVRLLSYLSILQSIDPSMKAKRGMEDVSCMIMHMYTMKRMCHLCPIKWKWGHCRDLSNNTPNNSNHAI